VLGFVDECRDGAGVVLMRETEQKVQEARNALFVGDGGYPAFDVRLDALIAAVREDERERCIRAIRIAVDVDDAVDLIGTLSNA